MKRKRLFAVLAACLVMLLGGCEALLGSLEGEDGETILLGPAGDKVAIIDTEEQKILNGGEYNLIASPIPRGAPWSSTLTLNNDSALALTLCGNPAIKDLGGWSDEGGTIVYGAVPELSVGPVSSTDLRSTNPVSFDLVNVQSSPISQPYTIRKRFRIALQDQAGGKYYFDFEVSATISS